jgi:hypothetical protein
VDLKFVDTVSGDTIVALRNNRGGPLSTGPSEHFVTVHPRAIQQQSMPTNRDVRMFDVMYSTSQDRIDRLTLFKESSAPDVVGMDVSQERILGITDMFVLPTGKGDGRLACSVPSLYVYTIQTSDTQNIGNRGSC